jgi:23S rRNA (uracil1939-C5)-methyltransferase
MDAHDILTIDSIIAGGDGLARHPDGFVVFVPGTAPGERVAVEYTETRKQWRRARVLELMDASSQRREPPCPHYGICGGCQLQHLNYPAQVEAKAGIIVDALRRIGKLEIDSVVVEPSPVEFEYRNRVSFVVVRDEEEVGAGFHSAEDPAGVVDVESCPLAENAIADAWQALRASWGPAAALLPAGPDLRLTLRATADGRVGLAIEGGLDTGEPARLMELVPALSAVWVLGRKGEVLGWAGAETLTETWGGDELPLAGTAFVQVNRGMAGALDAYARTQCDAGAGARVVDAYCGYGVRALELARSGNIVVGIDFDRGAIRAANRIARRGQLGAEFVAARVESALPRALPADVVVLNPPRRGVGREVIAALLENPPERIVYVSCDPATLARDLRALAAAFDLSAVRGFDLFPQTAHVETIATLSRRHP